MPKKMKNTQEQDYVTNKILAVFSLCLFGVMGLWYVNSLLRSNNFLIGLRIFSVMRWIGLALVIGSAAVMMMDQKNGRSSKRLFAGRNLLVASVLFTLLAFLLDRDPVRMIKLCYGLLPALAIYYLIYHSYQPEFFTVATDVGIGAALLIGIRMADGGMVGYAAAGLGILLAGARLLSTRRKLAGGKLPAGFGPHSYPVISVTAVLMAALVIAGALLGPASIFYLLCASAAYVFILAVYYTVKLM
ncbi:MAG: hypothetical protein HFH26_04900 [Clostridiaceae bacterium]|nr:hypothetical protein [Clostridiaceae bacterium]